MYAQPSAAEALEGSNLLVPSKMSEREQVEAAHAHHIHRSIQVCQWVGFRTFPLMNLSVRFSQDGLLGAVALGAAFAFGSPAFDVSLTMDLAFSLLVGGGVAGTIALRKDAVGGATRGIGEAANVGAALVWMAAEWMESEYAHAHARPLSLAREPASAGVSKGKVHLHVCYRSSF